MRRLLQTSTALFIACALCSYVRAADNDSEQSAAMSQQNLQFFESKIRPLLIEKCIDCHGADEQEAELRLDSWEGILHGGKSGPAIRPGKADGSLLLVAVSYRDNDLRMPPDGKLNPRELADLKRWIESGAAHPDRLDAGSAPQPRRTDRIDFAAARQFWSLQPIERPSTPDLEHVEWVNSDIDRFVLAKLVESDIKPSPKADRHTLIRRVTLDLIGLPPTPEEVTAFVDDPSPDAWSKVIERLLHSPHYGERWGRHWLDVARYADSNGLDENVAHGNAWRYRDYVINSFNEDMPYDEFLVEQIAGDLLPADPTRSDERQLRNRRRIATAFLALGPKVLAEPDATKMEMDIIDEQIDTLGKAILGLTFGCARCHTHKFDPISISDYYGLAGIFKSSRVMENYKKVARWHENEVPGDHDLERKREHDEQIAARKNSVDKILSDAKQALLASKPEGSKLPKDFEAMFPEETKAKLKAERDRLKALEAEAANLIPTAMGAVDSTVSNVAVHLRGSHLTQGDIVPRRVPEVFAHLGVSEFPDKSSGRLELARWLTGRDNPLTARVMVNRIWRWHFGRGIVASTDNFGRLGERPSHPKLLDWLAAEFVESGWSVRHLQRLILSSSVYTQDSRVDTDSTGADIDPDNKLLWRFPMRRMEAEIVRDSLLAASGMLERRMSGSMLAVKNREWVFNHLSVDPTKYESTQRSVYLPIIRNNLYDVFQLFDYSDASTTTGHRAESTVAPQALFMLNSPLVQDASATLAEHLVSRTELDDAARVRLLYETVLSRPPKQTESDRLLRFLSSTNQSSDQADAELDRWTTLCQVLLASNEFIFVR